MITPKSHPRIAIAGAGPAALTLGALLHKRNIPFTIFDLRPQPTAADLAQPSGMLDLHAESGLAAIRACGLWDQFLPLTADCAESMIIVDGSTGAVLHTDDGGSAERPEAARHGITKLMLGVVPEEAVRWGTKIVGAVHDETTGQTMLEICEGEARITKETFDLVIGADGAWSRIRPLLTNAVPRTTNLSYLTCIIENATTRFPALAERVGKGTYMALGHRHGIATQRGAGDSVMVTLFINDADVGTERLRRLGEMKTLGELREALLEDEALFGRFAEQVKELASTGFDDEERRLAKDNAHGSDTAVPRAEVKPLVMLPPGRGWVSKAGVTLIGDAAHVMLPTAGEGVNCAMRDALELSEVIGRAWEEASSPDDAAISGEKFQTVLTPLMRDFEETIVARAAEFSNEAMGNAEMMFCEAGAKGMADFMASHIGPPQGIEDGAVMPSERGLSHQTVSLT